jgi:chromosomal replication initiation ATPase DnaA
MNPYAIPGYDIPKILTQVGLNPYERMIGSTCMAYGVTLGDMICKCRKKYLCEPRQIIMALLFLNYGWTLDKIGDMFGKNHATVIHSANLVKTLSETDRTYRTKLKDILYSSGINPLFFETLVRE